MFLVCILREKQNKAWNWKRNYEPKNTNYIRFAFGKLSSSLVFTYNDLHIYEKSLIYLKYNWLRKIIIKKGHHHIYFLRYKCHQKYFHTSKTTEFIHSPYLLNWITRRVSLLRLLSSLHSEIYSHVKEYIWNA